MSAHDDRRSSPRYPAAGCPTTLGWWSGDEFRTTPLLLLDVSLGGVAAGVETDPPPAGSYAWVRVEAPEPTDWAAARILGVRRVRSGLHLLRLHFEAGCPYAFFRAAAYGDGLEGRDSADAPEFEARHWR